MNFSLFLFSAMCGLVLGGVAVSFFALLRGKVLFQAGMERTQAARAQFETEIQAIRINLEGLTAQVQEIQHQPHLTVGPLLPKPGLNLSKRSQALRMHRRGEGPDQIAAALEIPLQEVDLLLKVHRIVITTVP